MKIIKQQGMWQNLSHHNWFNKQVFFEIVWNKTEGIWKKNIREGVKILNGCGKQNMRNFLVNKLFLLNRPKLLWGIFSLFQWNEKFLFKIFLYLILLNIFELIDWCLNFVESEQGGEHLGSLILLTAIWTSLKLRLKIQIGI